MKLTKKGEYALKALIELAINYERGINTTLINSIAEKENIPPRYLEQILLNLKKIGLLISKRGVGGGYALSRVPEDISLGQVISAIEGPLFAFGDRKKVTSKDEVSCILYDTMKDVGSAMKHIVDGISLAEMAKKTLALVERKRGVLNYVI